MALQRRQFHLNLWMACNETMTSALRPGRGHAYVKQWAVFGGHRPFHPHTWGQSGLNSLTSKEDNRFLSSRSTGESIEKGEARRKSDPFVKRVIPFGGETERLRLLGLGRRREAPAGVRDTKKEGTQQTGDKTQDEDDSIPYSSNQHRSR